MRVTTEAEARRACEEKGFTVLKLLERDYGLFRFLCSGFRGGMVVAAVVLGEIRIEVLS